MSTISLANELEKQFPVISDTEVTENFLILPEHLGPVIKKETHTKIEYFGQPTINVVDPWTPDLTPFLEEHLENDQLQKPLSEDTSSADESHVTSSGESEPHVTIPVEREVEAKTKEKPNKKPIATKVEPNSELYKKDLKPSAIQEVDVHPEPAMIAILIDDLGYSRQGMEASLALPKEVALAILPETIFARKTALASQKQERITLLHAPMENQRELTLGPGGLYANMTESELKATLTKNLDSLPGIQGVNNHMGSLLTTKVNAMTWVMETLKGRSLFFIDSLTSPKSVAESIAQEHGLKTIKRDVFLDNIRTEKAIDKQFSRLIKLARLHGKALAIGHPYPETTTYLKKRLNDLSQDGVKLISLSEALLTSDNKR